MDVNLLDQSWQALLQTEQQLLRKFRSLRSALPALSPTPKRVPAPKVCSSQPVFGGILNNLNSPRKTPVQKNRQSLEVNISPSRLIPIRELVGKPRPLAWKVPSLHSRSSVSVKKVQNSESQLSSRSNSVDKEAEVRRIRCAMKLKRTLRDDERTKKKLYSVLTISPLQTSGSTFPLRERARRALESVPASRYLDRMIANQANQRRGKIWKRSIERAPREHVGLHCRQLPKDLMLADEDDEDKCVVDGEAEFSVHLSRYF